MKETATASDGKPGTAPNGTKRTRGQTKAKAPKAVYVMVQILDADGNAVKPAGEVKVTVAGDAHDALMLQRQHPAGVIAFGYPAAD